MSVINLNITSGLPVWSYRGSYIAKQLIATFYTKSHEQQDALYHPRVRVNLMLDLIQKANTYTTAISSYFIDSKSLEHNFFSLKVTLRLFSTNNFCNNYKHIQGNQ